MAQDKTPSEENITIVGRDSYTDKELRAVKTIRCYPPDGENTQDLSFDKFIKSDPLGLDLALRITELPDGFLVRGPDNGRFQCLDRTILVLQIHFVTRKETGWDNPITEHGRKLVWVHESFGLKPPPKKKMGGCYGCNEPLTDEGVSLSFGVSQPGNYCRKCVREARKALDFVAKADW